MVTLGEGQSVSAGIDGGGVVTAAWRAFQDDAIVYARLDLGRP